MGEKDKEINEQEHSEGSGKAEENEDLRTIKSPKEPEIAKATSPKPQIRDPLTFIFWAVAMIGYGSYSLYEVLSQPKVGNWSTFYSLLFVLLIIVGSLSLAHGIKKSRKVMITHGKTSV
jgi:hypothetical protein